MSKPKSGGPTVSPHAAAAAAQSGLKLQLKPCPAPFTGVIGTISSNLLHVVKQHPEISVHNVDASRYEADVKRLNELEKELTEAYAKVEQIQAEAADVRALCFTQYHHTVGVFDAFAENDPKLATELEACKAPHRGGRRPGQKNKTADTEPKK